MNSLNIEMSRPFDIEKADMRKWFKSIEKYYLHMVFNGTKSHNSFNSKSTTC